MKVYLKIFIALVVIVGALFWAVDSARTRSYSGTDLKVIVGQGAVTVTNPQDIPVPVQLVSPGTRTFSVSSSIAGAGGSSTRQGTGASATQLFELASPFGSSEFTVTRGTNVSLVTTTDIKLDVSVQPLTETDARTTIIVAAIVVLGALFYISRTTGHRWISFLRGKQTSIQPVKLTVAPAAMGQGPEIRTYGDNRADTLKP